MFAYGRSNYNKRYDNENKYESSSLSNVYRDLMSSKKENHIISPYDSKKYSNYNNYNNPTNYHFLNNNKNSNRSQYKSESPSPIFEIPGHPNLISNSISNNFFSNYVKERNNNNNFFQKEYNRNRSFDSKNNINKSSNNIFSYRNNNNSNYDNSKFNRKNFYDTITNFDNADYNKINNYLFINNDNKDNFRRNNNFSYNYSTSTYKPNISTFRNNVNENNNNYSNNNGLFRGFYSKSPEISNIRSYENKNNLFSNKNFFNNYNPIKSADFDNLNKLYRGRSQDNILNRNNYNNNYNNNHRKYKIASYSSSTMAGTNGYGITKTNQDSYIIKVDKNNKNEDEYTFGVFDGHGAEGHLVSQAIKQFFTNCSYFDLNSKSFIFRVFSSLSRTINNSTYFDSIGSGSTVILIHINPEKIISINCGDSRAILITKKKNIIPLSRDHKPEIPEEKERIEASGGRVDKIFGMGPFRVWFKDEDYPGLAMSRSIGDKLAHRCGVSDIPEIKEFNLDDVDPLAIIVASDGVWEFMSNDEVKNILLNYAYTKDANICAKNIVEKARQVWQGTGYAIDDITCVVAFFGD